MTWWNKGADAVLAYEDERMEQMLAEIRGLRTQVADLEGQRDANKEVLSLTESITRLKKQLTDLEIQEAKKAEEHARKEREVLHQVGLVRKEFETEKAEHTRELEFAKKEAKLELRQENLDSERKLFQKEMDFVKERFTEEQEQTRDLMGQILGRLPNVTAHFEKTNAFGAQLETTQQVGGDV